jgi:hypothetical protein
MVRDHARSCEPMLGLRFAPVPLRPKAGDAPVGAGEKHPVLQRLDVREPPVPQGRPY